VALSLLEHLIEPEREVVTVLCGQGATPALVSAIRTFVQTSHPDLVAEIHQGDQPDPVVFGVE
jgi:dihydroxyacetone kinase-like predicted kinase